MISSNASPILPSNMNEEQRLHQEKEAEVQKVASCNTSSLRTNRATTSGCKRDVAGACRKRR